MDIEEFLIAQKFTKKENIPSELPIYFRPFTILRFVLKDNSMYRIICNEVALSEAKMYTFIDGIQNHYVNISQLQYIEVLDCKENKFAAEYQKLIQGVAY